MEHAPFGIILIAPFEVILRVDSHITRRHRDIPVVRDIHTSRIVHLIIGACSDGERGYGALAMIEHGIHIGWEHTLVLIIHFYGRVCPPKEGLGQVRTVKHPSLNLQIGTARTQCKACHALLMEHTLHLVNPHRHRTILILHDSGVDRQIGRWTVVLRPVKLDATRDPRTRQTHQGGLDDVVIVHKVTLFDLIVSHLDTSAQLWQDHHLDIFVLNVDGLPLLIHLLVGDRLNDRIGIDHTTRTLIDSLLKEYRVLLGVSYFIRWYRHQLSPCFYHSFN